MLATPRLVESFGALYWRVGETQAGEKGEGGARVSLHANLVIQKRIIYQSPMASGAPKDTHPSYLPTSDGKISSKTENTKAPAAITATAAT